MLVGHDVECARILEGNSRSALQVVRITDDTVLLCMLMLAWGVGDADGCWCSGE